MILKPSSRFVVPLDERQENWLLKACEESQATLEFLVLMRERSRLHQLFRPDDSWPSEHFSLEQHQQDVQWQVSERLSRRSFAYTLWLPDESELLGGVHLYPSVLPEVEVEVFFWLVAQCPFDEAEFERWLRSWLVARWRWKKPVFPGRDMPWADWPGVTYPW